MKRVLSYSESAMDLYRDLDEVNKNEIKQPDAIKEKNTQKIIGGSIYGKQKRYLSLNNIFDDKMDVDEIGSDQTSIDRSIEYCSIGVNSPKQTIEKKRKKYHLILKKITLFFFHLLLISIFELIFFFSLVVNYEKYGIMNLIEGYLETFSTVCDELDPLEKGYFTYFVNLFLNETKIDTDARISHKERVEFNNKLLLQGIYYCIGILSVIIAIVTINKYFKLKIKFKTVIVDNIIMILILGIYEYIFFKTIVLRYIDISSKELDGDIVAKLQECGIK
jgi:hypothetical protein